MKILSAALLLISGVNYTHAKGLRRTQIYWPTIFANDDYYETIQEERLDVDAPGILANDSQAMDKAVANHEEHDGFRGNVRVYADGRIRYDPPRGDFLGTDSFTYTVCRTRNGVFTAECASAVVTIQVIVDPNKPAANPKAVDDKYSVKEGGTLNIGDPGFLGNDEHEADKPIYRYRRTSSPDGDIDTHSDGGFEYTAPKCWTGNDSFSYRVCYVDYRDMCDEATVTIEVTEDRNNRPGPPGAQNDRFTLMEGQELDVSRSNGVLSNDRPDKGQELYVEEYDEDSGFEGSLEVRSDGRVRYSPVPGKRGSFWFSYRACYREWDCVACRDARAEIVVEENPAKPNDPPTPVAEAYETTQDTELSISSSNGILVNDQKDSRYSLYVDSYDYDGGGELDIRSSGGFEYTPPSSSFLGTEIFTYVACYNRWPDLCATGSGTITVKVPSPGNDGDSSPRRGVATAYFVRWDASDDESRHCDEVEPRLTLRCAGDGELNLLDLANNDHSNCVTVNGALRCSAMNEGMVYAECRDGRADKSTRRQLIATLESDAVACDVDTSESFPLSWNYHVADVMTFCEETWSYKGMDCSGKLLNMTGGSTACYGDGVGSGPMLQPEPLTMKAENYEECLYF